MASVTVSRQIDGDVDAVTAAANDVEPFMRAAGFDDVAVDGTTVEVANDVGPVHIELTLELLDDSKAALAYEQTAGVFESMTTAYVVSEEGEGTRVEATTEFSLDAAVVGSVLDATVIRYQRRRELNAQFDYLEERVGG
ncbi:MAG: SRPBCC family protein [Salinigranum sp.]